MNKYVRLKSAAELHEEIQHLRLDRDVERGDRFVADQQLGLDGQRARDADARALAAGELVRKAPPERRVEPDFAHQLVDVVIDVVGGVDAVHARRLADDFGHTHARIERREGILKHHLDLQRDVAALRGLQCRDIGAAPCALAHGRRQDAGGDAAERRLAAARFAGEADHFAFVDGQAHVIERMHHDFVHLGAGQARDLRGKVERPRKVLGDMFQFEQCAHRISSSAVIG